MAEMILDIVVGALTFVALVMCALGFAFSLHRTVPAPKECDQHEGEPAQESPTAEPEPQPEYESAEVTIARFTLGWMSLSGLDVCLYNRLVSNAELDEHESLCSWDEVSAAAAAKWDEPLAGATYP